MRYGLWVVGFLIITLALRFFLFYSSKPVFLMDEEITLETTLLSSPQISGAVQRFWVDDILVISPRFPEYHYGDKLIISGRLEERLIANKKPVLTINFPKIKRREPTGILALTSFIRQKITAVFKNVLPQTESGLLLGIILGTKESLPQKFLEDLRISGTLHVIAASGMNIAIVGSFLTTALGFILRRQLTLAVSIFGIFFYALLAGFEPSIVRASIMGAVSYTALILGRQNLAILSLILAGYAMLFASPKTLFDIGFQLSFVATLGLITIKPELDKLRVVGLVRKYQVGNDFTTTIAAQLATLPIILANFGNYSLLSIFANTLVLWTIPPLMLLGGLAGIFASFFPFFSQILLLSSLPLLLIFERVVTSFASFGTQIKIANLPIILSLGFYLILASILWLKR